MNASHAMARSKTLLRYQWGTHPNMDGVKYYFSI